ncbi:hypothetical protein [Thalassobacillus sp. C254]|uniref:hypothetical protein n=1 Tax=Thalassobacillus sp. C254 TaxID=1225341 RepID=UPI0006D0D95E|nr:hypothetical protein [Thalassobacillus sp. C254]
MTENASSVRHTVYQALYAVFSVEDREALLAELYSPLLASSTDPGLDEDAKNKVYAQTVHLTDEELRKMIVTKHTDKVLSIIQEDHPQKNSLYDSLKCS